MQAYAEKRALNPAAMSRADLDGLRKRFTEEQVFEIVIITCFFNFMDRIADGFVVELDPIHSRLAASSPDGEALTGWRPGYAPEARKGNHLPRR